MSSHIFEEIERTCDRTAIIRDGKIVAIENMESLAKKRSKIYSITLNSLKELEAIKLENFDIVDIDGLQVSIKIKNNINEFLHKLTKYEIKDLDIKKQSLEEIFMHFYGKDGE